MNWNVERIFEAEPGKIFDRSGLRRRKEKRLSLEGRQVLEDRVHRLGKAHVQTPVSLVQNQTKILIKLKFVKKIYQLCTHT